MRLSELKNNTQFYAGPSNSVYIRFDTFETLQRFVSELAEKSVDLMKHILNVDEHGNLKYKEHPQLMVDYAAIIKIHNTRLFSIPSSILNQARADLPSNRMRKKRS